MSILQKKLNNSTLPHTTEPKDLNDVQTLTGNLYESIYVAIQRANQLNSQIKQELDNQLEEFDVHVENPLDVVQENKEQIELSKMYERLPNPALQAVDELLQDKLFIYTKASE
ncbi:MAG: DNA-directed RNA polymerase subunit omega [Chitinophagaceae bacterium]